MELFLRSKNQYEPRWITLYVNGDNVTCFESFRVEYVPKEMKKFIANKTIMSNY